MTARDFGDALVDLGRVPALLEKNLKAAARMGGELAASEAKSKHSYKDRSGVLSNSIAPEGPTGSFVGGDLEVVLSAGAPYASFVEDGTAPHLIKPKHRRALRWAVEGGFAFSGVVHHPGTTGTHFLEEAVESVMPALHDKIVPQAIELSFVQAGLARD